jgi:hypothetical protein
MLIWILALGIACRDEDPGNDGNVTPGDSTLTLALPQDVVRAGEAAPYTATLTDEDGSTQEVDPVLRSDLEPGIAYDASALTPTVVGTHTIAASWEDYEASATLEVIPGPAASVDLVLEAATVVSGQPLAYEVHATDAWGNTVDGAGAAIIASSTHVAVESAAGTVSADLAGTYDLTAILDGKSDTESFSVIAGPGATIELVLTPTALEVGDRATAQVTIEDAAGNTTTDPYTLEVVGVPFVLDGDEITFQGEGWFTVTATVDGTSASDSVGPILIDSTGPDIAVSEPPRATWAKAWLGHDATEVGTITDAWSDVASAERGGEPLTLDTGGAFSVEDDDAYHWGITVTETEAIDTDGNVSTDKRSALLGYFLGADNSAWSGIRVRLDDGPGGLDLLEDLGSDLVPPDTLGDMISNPVFEDSSLFYSVSLDVTNPGFTSSDLDLDCTSAGIETTFTITDASMDYDATGRVIGVPYSTDGTITMDSIEVTLLAIPSVSGGAIYTEVSDLDVAIVGFDFPMANWLEDVLDFFGVDVDDIVKGYVEDALRASLQDRIPSLLDDTLSAFEMSETVPVMGVDYVFEAVPSDVLVDDDGLTLVLDTTFDGGPLTTPHPTLGFLIGDWDDPAWPSSGAAIGVGADFVNQVLHAIWGNELLDVEAPIAEMGIDPAALALILPDVKDPIFVLDPMLPPVVAPIAVTGGAGQFTFEMGDARLSIYDGTVDDDHRVLDAYLALQADLSIEVGPDLALVPSFGATTFWVDVVEPRIGEETTEDLLGAVAPLLLPSVTDLLSGIPLPSLSGFSLDKVSVSTSADGGYAVLGGELVPE